MSPETPAHPNGTPQDPPRPPEPPNQGHGQGQGYAPGEPPFQQFQAPPLVPAPSLEDPSPAPLIVSSTPMRGARPIPDQPHQAQLFKERTGAIVRLPSHPGWRDVRRYTMRYVVDMSQRHAVETKELPSATHKPRFRVTLEIDWGVTEPVAVLERGFTGTGDALKIIWPRLWKRVRALAARFPGNDLDGLQRHLDREFDGRLPTFAEGIGVFHCTAEVEHEHRFEGRQDELDQLRHELTKAQINSGWVDAVTSEWDVYKRLLQQGREAEVLDRLQAIRNNQADRTENQLNMALNNPLSKDIADAETLLQIIQQVSGGGTGSVPPSPPSLAPGPPGALPSSASAEGDPSPVGPFPYPEPEEDEDIMPADIVDDGSTAQSGDGDEHDHVTGWVSPPWLRGDRAEDER